MPVLPSVSSYRFSFESLEALPRNPVVRDSDQAYLNLELSAGSWNLTVTALTGSGSPAKEIARGSARVLVVGGITNSVTVRLGNEPGGETGTLSYTASFPAAVTHAALTLASMGGGTDYGPVNLLEGSTAGGGVITKTGVLNAAAGNYLLTIDLYDGAGNAGKTEVVHLYSNTETPAGAVAFTAGDFNPTTEYQTGSGRSLSAVLTDLALSTSGTDFTVVLGQDEPAFTPFILTAAAFGGKTIRLRGEGHTVALGGTGSLFTLETGAALVLQDVELQGRNDNTGALMRVTGGDLLMHTGTVITGNTFSTSESNTTYVGGVIVDSGTFTMNGGTITGNSASGPNGHGGGVYVRSGTFAMSGGTISGNTSSSSSGHSYGGGVVVDGGSTFAMSGGTISGNTSSSSSGGSSGGGVSVYGTFTMSGGTISGNSSSYGGGVYSVGTFIMSGGTISENTAHVGSWYGGGGVGMRGGTFTMNGGFITRNTATSDSYHGDGGGVYIHSGAFTMNDGIISENSSRSSGGGVSVGTGGGNGAFAMSGGTISGNASYAGGGVSIGGTGASATFTMSGGTISGNTAIAIDFFSSVGSGGGGVSVGSGTFAMSGGTVTGNSAINGYSSSGYGGGGVSVNYYGAFAMSGGTVTGNSSSWTTTKGSYASSNGDGVYVSGGTFAMGNNARIDASNEVCLDYANLPGGGKSYASVTLVGDFSGGDTLAVIDLRGAAADWLWQPVLARDAGYTGTIPVNRFTLRNFVGGDYSSGISKTPITSYVVNSDGKLANQ
jgi:hypothetical protein